MLMLMYIIIKQILVTYMMGLAKKFIWFSCERLQKNPKELFG